MTATLHENSVPRYIFKFATALSGFAILQNIAHDYLELLKGDIDKNFLG